MIWALLASVVSVIATVTSVIIVYMDKRRLITPAIDFDVIHFHNEKKVKITIKLARLEKQPYSLESIHIIDRFQTNILAITEEWSGSLVDIRPTTAVFLNTDIQAEYFSGHKHPYEISLIMEKPQKFCIMRITYRTSFFPNKAWHEIPISKDPRPKH